jgi:predicted dehydrogenase/threonine dehydrogenase-like Zn-dependent dehydrogenase
LRQLRRKNCVEEDTIGMRLVQSVKSGDLMLADHPELREQGSQVLVHTSASLISSGTERSLSKLAGASLVSKARARPDLVRAVVDRARQDGLRPTYEAVRSRLADEVPVGYSAAGQVTEVGELVQGIRPGDRVATAGAGHADVQMVPGTMAARMPDGVSFEEAAFGAVASVGLHGLRLAGVGPGSRVLVVGLGLIGQLTARLALASGLEVVGSEPDPWKRELASRSGVVAFSPGADGIEAIMDWTEGRGVDAVLVTAATQSSEPMRSAALVASDRATIVAVGDVGLDLDRRPLYEKELTVKVSRAYGAGRYDHTYEDLAVDYPVSYEPFTIRRNLETVMGLIASGRLEVADLITHRYPFDDAIHAYDVFDRDDPYLGILLKYGTEPAATAPVPRRTADVLAAETLTPLASGLIGAGRFASSVLLPNAGAAGFGPWTQVASQEGVSAARVAESFGFSDAVGSGEQVIGDPGTGTVFIASRHDSHAELAAAALQAGKHVFCEKPLAISDEELACVVEAHNSSPGVLMVGFNRRWSEPVDLASRFVGRGTPMQVMYRVHAGSLPKDHWLHDRRQGGRLLGEGCHFIDTCNAVMHEVPRRVYAVGSGVGELLLQQDFTITLDYPSGSQAVIMYSSGSPRGAGKERIDIMRGDRSAEIEDFRRLTLRSTTGTDTKRFKPADKGHAAEFVVFREAIERSRDAVELAASAVATSRAALAAVESLMTGTAVDLDAG